MIQSAFQCPKTLKVSPYLERFWAMTVKTAKVLWVSITTGVICMSKCYSNIPKPG